MSPAPRMLLRSQSDRRLADLARAGSAPAFEVLVERHRRAMLRHCERIAGESGAQDAVQQACLAAWNALRRDVEVREPRAWLVAIAHREALRLLSERAALTVADLESVPAEGSAEPGEDRRRVRETFAAIVALPDNQREALVLTELEGRSRAEVASLLGVTDGAVRQLVHRARAGVRAAVTAVTPMGLMLRLAGTGGDATRERLIEAAAGGGAGAAAVIIKVTAVVAVVGTATGLGVSGGSHRAGAEARRPAHETAARTAAAPAARSTAPAQGDPSAASGTRSAGARAKARVVHRHGGAHRRATAPAGTSGRNPGSHGTQTAVVFAPAAVHRVVHHTSSDSSGDSSSADTTTYDDSSDPTYDDGSDSSSGDTTYDDSSDPTYDDGSDSSSGDPGYDSSAGDSSADDTTADSPETGDGGGDSTDDSGD